MTAQFFQVIAGEHACEATPPTDTLLNTTVDWFRFILLERETPRGVKLHNPYNVATPKAKAEMQQATSLMHTIQTFDFRHYYEPKAA